MDSKLKQITARCLTAAALLSASESANAASSMFTIPDVYWGAAKQPEAHGNGMVGYAFRVKNAITVTQVGWYDDGEDGLSRPFQIGLWQDLSGGYFQQGAPVAQLLGIDDSGIVIPGGTDAILQGVWRVVSLPTALVLQPGNYQIAGLDTAATPDIINYIWDVGGIYSLSNADVDTGLFFYAEMPDPTLDFGVTHNFYLAGGLELGPMLFVVPEPSGCWLGVAGIAFLSLRRPRRSHGGKIINGIATGRAS